MEDISVNLSLVYREMIDRVFTQPDWVQSASPLILHMNIVGRVSNRSPLFSVSAFKHLLENLTSELGICLENDAELVNVTLKGQGDSVRISGKLSTKLCQINFKFIRRNRFIAINMQLSKDVSDRYALCRELINRFQVCNGDVYMHRKGDSVIEVESNKKAHLRVVK